MSITKRFVIQLCAIALPILLFVGCALYWQLESGLSSMTADLHSQTLASAANELDSRLDIQQRELSEFADSAPLVRPHLLAHYHREGLQLLTINHYGELHWLLPDLSYVDATRQGLIDELQKRLNITSFQHAKSGLIEIEGNYWGLTVLPQSTRESRGLAMLFLLSEPVMQSFSHGSSLISNLRIIPTASTGSQVHLAVTSFQGKPLSMVGDFQNWQSAQKSQLLFLVLGSFGAALGLLLLISLTHMHRQLVAPSQRMLAYLNKHRQDSDWRQPIKLDNKGATAAIAQVINDLSSAASESYRFHRSALSTISDAVIMVDDLGRITQLSPVAQLLLERDDTDVTGHYLTDIMPGTSGAQLDAILVSMLNGGPLNEEGRIQLASSQKAKMVDFSIRRVESDSGCIGAVVTLKDITSSEVLKLELRRKSQRDSVSGLFNRQSFDHQLAQMNHDEGQHAICFLDLARFKLINDSCGNDAGDRMLKDVSDAMLRSIKKSDFLARIGGDEFGLILNHTTAQDAARQLKTLMDKVRGITLYWDSGSYNVGIHIGVAFHRGNGNPKEILKDAELACEVAKTKGDSQIHFFDAMDQDLAHQRNAPAWAMKINEAILNDNLVLFFQPIEQVAGTATRKRMEILLRIQEENGSILAPGQFIEAAERFNLMPAVDRVVIRKAFEWLARHPELWPYQVISINLSGTTLSSDGLVDYVDDLTKSLSVPTECVCFEVTETAAIANENRALDMLHSLRKRGFAFALDDFGSGFASYGYLRQLPVDYVKIDGCFVRNLATNAKDYAIVKSIHDVCRVIGIETVAEFVEDQDTLDQLKAIGVTYAQGYGIGRPKDLETYEPDLSMLKQVDMA